MLGVDLTRMEAWDKKSGDLCVIIETPKGSRNKYALDPSSGLFELSKVLPRGTAFPFDFGFVPSTAGEDGDPLDILVLMDEPAFAGCRVLCRLIGVMEARQVVKSKSIRNDRLIAVARECREDGCVRSLKDLPDELLDEIEHFFVSYHALDGKKLEILGRRGSKRATKLVQSGEKSFAKHE